MASNAAQLAIVELSEAALIVAAEPEARHIGRRRFDSREFRSCPTNALTIPRRRRRAVQAALSRWDLFEKQDGSANCRTSTPMNVDHVVFRTSRNHDGTIIYSKFPRPIPIKRWGTERCTDKLKKCMAVLRVGAIAFAKSKSPLYTRYAETTS